MSDQKQGLLAFDWALVFYWMMATTSGWLFGWLVWPALSLVTAGVLAGATQCVVLLHRIPRAWRWFLVTGAGWLAGTAMVLLATGTGVVAGLAIGTFTGTAQWLLLRREVRWSGWWIPISAIAWAVGLGLAPSPEAVLLPRVVLSGTMASVITGVTLELLLRFPRPAEEQGETEER
jgi:hypothetical protein